MDDMKVKVENMVSAITIDQKINLAEFSSTATGVRYNPKNFPGVVYRIKNPAVAMLIFSSGKVICTGARSKKDIEDAAQNLIEKFKESNIIIKSKPKIEVQNIVASAKLDFEVNLDLLAMECENTEYEPEQFPGLVFRLADPKTVMLIFRSGKMIITGARSLKDVKMAAIRTREMFEEFNAAI
ncbi:MAG: hypothetical protein MSIBF_03180 [Candidatus Altiarchaeales archaeon IMC4]|nr:MAG: hypothetical protein MSIBF_03180 [Candidatus Altiarchaeales archaeon IMC4]